MERMEERLLFSKIMPEKFLKLMKDIFLILDSQIRRKYN